MITALVLINADRRRIPETAQALLGLDGVVEVFSVTGEYDLVATVRLKEYDQLATVVTEQMAALDAIAGDYAAHCRAAQEIAREYFAAERVLSSLLADAAM